MEDIKEELRLIDKFMGCESENPSFGYFVPNPYNSDWNLLMPVVEKIESMGYNFNIHKGFCLIIGVPFFGSIPHSPDSKVSKITYVYQSVIQFIKWYNQNGK